MRGLANHEALSARLAAAGCVAADDEALELLATTHDPRELEALVARREQGEPLAWLTGGIEFCGHRILVDHGVYVPRWQSEAMAKAAGAWLVERGPGAVAVDLCTGAGAVACHLMRSSPSAGVLGVELDLLAAKCAARNGVSVMVGDLGHALSSGCADLITAVAPYVPTDELAYLPPDVVRFEPRGALDGGADGLSVIRGVIEAAARLLHSDGALFFELGGDQGSSASEALDAAGFREVALSHDEEGDLRWLSATKR